MANLTEYQQSLLTDEATVTITAPCPSCSGTGRSPQHQRHCCFCGRSYTGAVHDAELAAASGDSLPCGHEWRYLDEDDRCHECECTGKVTDQVPLLALVAWALGRLNGEA